MTTEFEVHDRTVMYIPLLSSDYDNLDDEDWEETEQRAGINQHVADVDDANLVGSLLIDGSGHRPVLDIDFPARLVPSKTEGHYHLYLDGVVLSDDQYQKLLLVLAEVGILEQGYVNASIERGMTRVRLPEGVGKRPAAAEDVAPPF